MPTFVIQILQLVITSGLIGSADTSCNFLSTEERAVKCFCAVTFSTNKLGVGLYTILCTVADLLWANLGLEAVCNVLWLFFSFPCQALCRSAVALYPSTR